ncbi:MAG: 3-deoxy-D-manno-octulosonic acid transferase [Nautilia sp.]|nr:MAG: 3-deoxy-D-manno-octulosonic acid transferase [Nautilia sp.]
MAINIIYYIFAFFLYLISIPFLIFFSFKKKYTKSIPARFFLIKNPPFKKPLNHFHSCSLGETKALKPIIEHFDEVNLSVITNTGYEEAKKYKNADVRFLPFEIFLPFWQKKCKSLVVVEAELWLMLFIIAKKRCQKTILINARISNRSYPKYLKFKWFYKHLFKYIDVILAQSDIDKKRLLSLGAKNVKVVGNIKSIVEYKITKHYKKPNKELIIAGSTHEGEEEIILNAYKKNSILVIVPRHPERFDEVYEKIKKFATKNNLSYGRINEGLNKDIILVDKMGELINLYAIADKVILGGSFVDNVGGHNPLEIAYFNKPLISGKYIFNQYSLFELVENANIIEKEELKEYLNKDLKPTKIKNRANIDEILKEIDV